MDGGTEEGAHHLVLGALRTSGLIFMVLLQPSLLVWVNLRLGHWCKAQAQGTVRGTSNPPVLLLWSVWTPVAHPTYLRPVLHLC